MHLPFRLRRPDPYWGLDGRAAQRARRHRHVITAIVILLGASILVLTLARLAVVDSTSLLRGPQRLLLLASVGGDAIACFLIFAAESGRRESLRRLAEASDASG